MKSLLWILAIFALAVGLSLTTSLNEGYVLIVMPPYRTELPLYAGILVMAAGFAAFHFLLRLLSLALSLPRRMRESRARARRDKAAETFGEGVRLYLAGEERKALKTLGKVREGEGTWPALAASLAARAAGEIGAEDERREWQSRAARLDPRTKSPASEATPEAVPEKTDGEKDEAGVS